MCGERPPKAAVCTRATGGGPRVCFGRAVIFVARAPTADPPLPAIEGLWAHDALRLATVQHALGDAEKSKLRPSLVKSGKQKGGQALSQRVDYQMGQVLCAGSELKHTQKGA